MRRTSWLLSVMLCLGIASAPVRADEATDDSSTELIGRYLEASKVQQSTLRDASMDVDIDAKIPKWKKEGKGHALRMISKLGQVTFRAIHLTGDDTVKKEVIVRYLQTEMEAHDFQAMAITPANYKFKYRGLVENSGNTAYVFQLTPRKKVVGLFKGELWLDQKTCLPVRETGRFVKSPSIWLKSVKFVREYQIQDGIAVPKRIESSIDTRIAGVAEIGIAFSNFTPNQQDPELVTPMTNSQ